MAKAMAKAVAIIRSKRACDVGRLELMRTAADVEKRGAGGAVL